MKRIEKIEISKPIISKKKRVAAYARVSIETDRLNHSLSTQISYYNKLIQNNRDWQFVGVYADSGITGTRINKREEFKRLIRDCKEGKIDIVLTKSIQRFARNTVDLLNTVRELKEIGIEVRFEKENINSLSGDGELMLSILASFAQEESRSISENVKWGTVKRFKQGIPNGKFSIYGYEWEGDKLVKIEHEAQIVRRIYKEYLTGKSRIQIAKILENEGLRTRRGNRWADSNVKVILTNIHYTGNLLFQKEYIADPITGKTKKNRGELPQYFVENTHEPIITMEEFREVEKEMLRRRNAGPHGNPALNTTELTGKIKCPCCNISFYSTNRSQKRGKVKVWICGKRKEGKNAKCKTGEIQDLIIKEVLCETLGMVEYDSKVIESILEKIEIVQKEKIIIKLNDNTEYEVPYRTYDRRRIYTEEFRKRKSDRQKNKHIVKHKKAVTPFTGLIECGKCGENLNSQKRKNVSGEVIHRMNCKNRKKICEGNGSIKVDTLKEIICKVLKLDEFNEEIMDDKVERMYKNDNKVRVKLKNGEEIIEEYLEKRPFIPWTETRRNSYERRKNE